ncbi:putative carboxylesterase [Listeria floridensis FSL S10-1187]|uniref:Carboxylesterase n=1 Tax=Listeria floridensis FSL S10-1187 TaxID=1265817 RepID=A0ABN0RE70_9LIST|nr:alpha/beta fold hydrolase [Listeria floridensis]EUJ30740.1 putative carboxylesterase [Listeria floridensis FSL S10-1187]
MVACLCIHGYTGTPDEIKPLADYLRAHTDWDVLTPTLPGHDNPHHLRNATYEDWIIFMESILTQLLKEDEEVYLIGFSMGGLLAGWLTRHHPEVKKLALLSTSVNYLDWPNLVVSKEQLFVEVKDDSLENSSVFGRYFKKFTDVPKQSKAQLAKMVAQAKPVFEHIEIPTFIAQGGMDAVIPPKQSIDFLMDTIPAAKELFVLEEAGHLICQDKDNQILFEKLLAFLKE